MDNRNRRFSFQVKPLGIAISLALTSPLAWAQTCTNLSADNMPIQMECQSNSLSEDVTYVAEEFQDYQRIIVTTWGQIQNGLGHAHADVKNVNISTATNNQIGLLVVSYNGDASAKLHGSNTIELNGAADTAIYVKAYDRKASINISDELNITNNALSSSGFATSNGITATGKQVEVIHSGSGKIVTYGGSGIYTMSLDPLDNGDAGYSLINLSGNAEIEVHANNGKGIFGLGDGINSNMIISNATVTTTGSNSMGIGGWSQAGSNGIHNSGTITTLGAESSAIASDSDSGKTTVINDGVLRTSGERAYGINAVSMDGDIGIQNNNTITTDGYSAHGLQATTQTGAIKIINHGDIVVNYADPLALTGTMGIYARSDGEGDVGDVLVENSANITSHAKSSSAIRARVGGVSPIGDVVVKHLAGTLEVQGEFSSAINVEAGGIRDSDLTVYLAGDIVVGAGANSGYGIYVNHKNADSAGGINIINDGLITVDSAWSRGIFANSNSSGGINIHTSGNITTNSAGSSAIMARNSAETGDITVTSDNAVLNINGSGSHGIYAINESSESTLNINIATNGGAINLLQSPTNAGSSNNDYGVYAGHQGAAAGNINIVNNGTDIAIGLGQDNTASNSSAIYAAFHDAAASGNISIYNSGNLSTQATGTQSTVSAAIYARNQGSGDVEIVNLGHISTYGDGAFGIHAIAEQGGNVSVTSHADILIDAATNSNAVKAISVAASGGCNATVVASGNISVLGTAGGSSMPAAIEARSDAGNATVYYANGTVQSNDTTIMVWGNDPTQDKKGEITLGANSVVKSTEGYGLRAIVSGGNLINTAATAQINGARGIQLRSVSANSVNTINHAGVIDVTSDLAVSDKSKAGIRTEINNNGTINGYVTFGAGDTSFSNGPFGVLNLRNFSDSDNDGMRDSKAVAVIDFGAGNDVFNNESNAVLQLALVKDELSVNTTGQYVTEGALSTAIGGIVQGHLLNLNRFENRGVIDLTANQQAGDVLVISGAANAGTNGGGQFLSDGGTLMLDTHLNQGHDASLSDLLVVDNATLGSGGPTKIIINRVDGTGELTVGNGIKIVEVLESADANSFVLGNVVKGGIYEYTLHQGENEESLIRAGGSGQHWYLRNSADRLNPDIGSYLSNQTAATGLFMHSLHDRLGEPQYTERYAREGQVSSMWLRAVSTNTKNQAGGGLLGQNTNGSLLHLGGDVAQWSSDGNDRYHLGLMAAYGQSESTSTSRTTGSRAKGKIDGYGVGAYLTWYGNEAMPEGAYADLWSMYNWFDNEVEGTAKYDSHAWTSSAEFGYAKKAWQGARMQVMVEPHAQLAYTRYGSDSHTDNHGLSITDEDASGIQSRLGARTYLRDSLDVKKAQPFIEANWLHSTAKNTLHFNGKAISDDTPKDRLEVKVGVQGRITENLQVYSHLGLQWGKDDYSKSEGTLGFKYRF